MDSEVGKACWDAVGAGGGLSAGSPASPTTVATAHLSVELGDFYTLRPTATPPRVGLEARDEVKVFLAWIGFLTSMSSAVRFLRAVDGVVEGG